jgi:hypothetical protein
LKSPKVGSDENNHLDDTTKSSETNHHQDENADKE